MSPEQARAEDFDQRSELSAPSSRIAQIYTDEDEYLRAVHALTDLANRFPTNPHDAWSGWASCTSGA